MRWISCLLVAQSVLITSALAQEFRVGDQVVSTRRLTVKPDQGQGDEVVPGVTLTILATKEHRLLVRDGLPGHPGNFVGKPGWLDRDDVIPLDQAAAYFSGEIKRMPGSNELLFARMLVLNELQRFDDCLADLDQLVEMDPNNRNLRETRAMTYLAAGRFDKAIGDLNQIIRAAPASLTPYVSRAIAKMYASDFNGALADVDRVIKRVPRDATLYQNRGMIWLKKGEYDKAVDDFKHGLELNPDHPAILNSWAWLEATCPDPRHRSGRAAMEKATKACELMQWKSASFVGTLAAACAEASEFEQAVDWQEEAIRLRPKYDKDLPQEQAKLKLYRSRQAFRDKTST